MSEPENPSSEAVEEVDEEDHTEEAGDTGIANQLMKNPGVLAALQDKLCSIVGSPSGYIQSLPKEVKRRIKALKKLQNDMIHVEAEFYREVNALEKKYAPKYTPLYDLRKEILSGKTEPTDEQCEWPSDEEEDEEKEEGKDEEAKLAPNSQQADLKNVAIEGSKEAAGDGEAKKEEDVKGIPSFWLTVFKNVDLLNEMVQEHDEPILTHLQDIRVDIHEKAPVGFTLEFHFEPNEYFTDTVLTKRYEMRYEPDASDPFGFEGPEIIKCTGCTINWNKGKNVTVKQIKKKQKHKGRGLTRTVTKQVQADSFFNFFNPPTAPEESESEVDEETESLLGADFEIGHFIRERIIPRAVLFFTGEAIDNEDYEDEENEEGEDDDYDEDNDGDYNPEAAGKPSECKQQ